MTGSGADFKDSHTSDSRISRRRQWLFRLLALVGGPLIFFLLLELALRIGDVGDDPRFFVPIKSRAPVEGRKALTANDGFGWRFFPRAQARRPLPLDVETPRPSGVTRIAVLGGSAAMGIPDPAFSFARLLEVMLNESQPREGQPREGQPREGARFEVVQTAMTAINSHVVREIAGELDRIEPDVVLIYMGNNEVVGPFGAASSREGGPPPSLAAVRARLRLTSTRTGQLLSRGLALSNPGQDGQGQESQGWRGMEAFTERQLLPGDPALERIYENFERNLEDIVRRASKTGAQVLVATVAVDLMSTPPFVSVPPADAKTEQQLQEALEASRAAVDGSEALRQAESAARLAPDYAQAHFELGQAQLRSGLLELGRASLERARDLDALRFRADSEINRRIRRVAGGGRAADGAADGGRPDAGSTEQKRVVLVDAEELLADRSADGVPGRDFFFEHVHFTAEGAYEVARAFYLELADPERATEAEPPSLDFCLERLGFSDWHRLGQLEDITAMMARPPFTQQVGHGERLAAMRREYRELRGRLDTGAYQRTANRLEEALAGRPDDIALRRSLAELRRSGGAGEQARRLLEPLLERLPHSPGLWLDAGNAALADDDTEAAQRAYERAIELDPYAPDSLFNLAALEVRQGRYQAAASTFRRVLNLDAGHLEARLNLAAALDELDQKEEALRQYQRAHELSPEQPVAAHRLASALEQRGKGDEARQLLEETVETFPQDARTQLQWARRLAEEGRTDDAIRHYAAAARIDPELDEALMGLVEAHNRRASERAAAGDENGAISALYEALAAAPDHAPSRFNLAMVLGRAGRVEPAIRHLEIAWREARRSGLETLENEAESRLRALGRPPVDHSAEN